MKIGIVDDHPFIIEAYKNCLEKFQCVIEAFNGLEMIEKFKKLDKNDLPELMIIDINMPVMNGFETVEWLKSNYPNIKLIVASVYDDEETILRMIRLGVNSYLTKSRITIHELSHAITEVNETGNYFTSRVTELIVKSYQNSSLTDIERKIQSLTEREVAVIKLICEELTSLEIASKLIVSPRTVETFTQKILSKLNVKSRVGIALFAEKNGLLI